MIWWSVVHDFVDEIVVLSGDVRFITLPLVMRRLIPIGLCLGLLISNAPATPQVEGKVKTEDPAGERRTYKQSAGKPRELELYFPPGHDRSKKVPGLILFHGGGWGGGTLAQFRAACAYFASRGLVCATAEYRMLSGNEAKALPAGETKKRVCITDGKSAIRWFKQHAGELGVDPARIVAGGGSAGAHISTLATLNPGLNDPADPAGIDTSVAAYLWFNPAFSPEVAQDPEVDVLLYIKKDLPPAYVCFGTKDAWKKGWDAADAKWKETGNTSIEMFLAEGKPHGFFNMEPWKTVTLVEADRFLVRHGFLKGEPTMTMPASGEKMTK